MALASAVSTGFIGPQFHLSRKTQVDIGGLQVSCQGGVIWQLCMADLVFNTPNLACGHRIRNAALIPDYQAVQHVLVCSNTLTDHEGDADHAACRWMIDIGT